MIVNIEEVQSLSWWTSSLIEKFWNDVWNSLETVQTQHNNFKNEPAFGYFSRKQLAVNL